jgi:hypothetical protein
MFQTKFVEKLKTHILCSINFSELGWDSIVGIAICYGVDGLEIKSWLGAEFPTPVLTSSGAHPTSYTMGTVSFPGVKQLVCGNHPPPIKHQG